MNDTFYDGHDELYQTNKQTNKPISSFFTGRMPFLSPNQQCQSTEGKKVESTLYLKYSLHLFLVDLGKQVPECLHSGFYWS